jgi:hypothetical protein
VFLCHRVVPLLAVARFGQLGVEGYEFLAATLGILHADCCTQFMPLL